MDCSLPGYFVHGILQARILEWVAISFSRGTFPPRNRTCISSFGRRIPYRWATWEAILSRTPGHVSSSRICEDTLKKISLPSFFSCMFVNESLTVFLSRSCNKKCPRFGNDQWLNKPIDCLNLLVWLFNLTYLAGWHHQLDGRESQWTPGVGDGQGGLACWDSWGRKESDMTELLIWSDLIFI